MVLANAREHAMLKWNGNVMRRVQAVAASVCAMVAAFGATPTRVEAQTLPSANLVVNGAADNGMTGWRVYEGSVGVRALTAPGVSNGTVFWGNTSAIGRADQTIWLSSQYFAAIDAGCVEVDFFAMLGGWTNQGDYAIARFEVYDRFGNRTSQTDLGPVTPAQRGNVTQLLARSARIALPSGSRRIRVEFVSARATGTNNDGYLDDIRVVLLGTNFAAPPSFAGAPVEVVRQSNGQVFSLWSPTGSSSVACGTFYWIYNEQLLSDGDIIGGSRVTGTRSSQLLFGPSLCQGGQFRLTFVPNAFGSQSPFLAGSLSTATLDLTPQPSFFQSPFVPGSPIRLSIDASGLFVLDASLEADTATCGTFMWYVGDQLIQDGDGIGDSIVAGATTPRLTLEEWPCTPTASFRMVFVPGAGGGDPQSPLATSTAPLDLPSGEPVFIEQPQGFCAAIGSSARSLRVRASYGDANLTESLRGTFSARQWFKDGVALPGQTSEVLFVGSGPGGTFREADAGVYRCRLFGLCGTTVWSDEATVSASSANFTTSVQDAYVSCLSQPQPLVLRHDLPAGTTFRWERRNVNGSIVDLRSDARFGGAIEPVLRATGLLHTDLSTPVLIQGGPGQWGGSTSEIVYWDGPSYSCIATLPDGCEYVSASGRFISTPLANCVAFGASFGLVANNYANGSVSDNFRYEQGPVAHRRMHTTLSGGGSTGSGFASATARVSGQIVSDGEAILVTYSAFGEASVGPDDPQTPLIEYGSANMPVPALPELQVDAPVWAQYGFGGEEPSGQATRFDRLVPLRVTHPSGVSVATSPWEPGSQGATDSFSVSVKIRLTLTPPPGTCDPLDFNNDGLFPDDADLLDFLSVLAGGPCSVEACSDIDFNNDGLFPDDTDLLAFLRVLAGGSCE
jgi:hypothetical protein